MDSGRTFQEIDQGIREVCPAAIKKRGLKRIARKCSARGQRRMKETEERVIELRNSGKTFQEISAEMGWKSRQAAHGVYVIAIEKRGQASAKGGCPLCHKRVARPYLKATVDPRFHSVCLRTVGLSHPGLKELAEKEEELMFKQLF